MEADPLLCRIGLHRWRLLTNADADLDLLDTEYLRMMWEEMLISWHQCRRCGWREPR